jgi:hypothetical protein
MQHTEALNPNVSNGKYYVVGLAADVNVVVAGPFGEKTMADAVASVCPGWKVVKGSQLRAMTERADPTAVETSLVWANMNDSVLRYRSLDHANAAAAALSIQKRKVMTDGTQFVAVSEKDVAALKKIGYEDVTAAEPMPGVDNLSAIGEALDRAVAAEAGNIDNLGPKFAKKGGKDDKDKDGKSDKDEKDKKAKAGKKPWEEAGAERLVATHTNGNRTAKVYKDNDWGVHRVKFYVDGKHQTNADSEDDREGCTDTAKSWVAQAKESLAHDGGSKQSLEQWKAAMSKAHPGVEFHKPTSGADSVLAMMPGSDGVTVGEYTGGTGANFDENHSYARMPEDRAVELSAWYDSLKAAGVMDKVHEEAYLTAMDQYEHDKEQEPGLANERLDDASTALLSAEEGTDLPPELVKLAHMGGKMGEKVVKEAKLDRAVIDSLWAKFDEADRSANEAGDKVSLGQRQKRSRAFNEFKRACAYMNLDPAKEAVEYMKKGSLAKIAEEGDDPEMAVDADIEAELGEGGNQYGLVDAIKDHLGADFEMKTSYVGDVKTTVVKTRAAPKTMGATQAFVDAAANAGYEAHWDGDQGAFVLTQKVAEAFVPKAPGQKMTMEPGDILHIDLGTEQKAKVVSVDDATGDVTIQRLDAGEKPVGAPEVMTRDDVEMSLTDGPMGGSNYDHWNEAGEALERLRQLVGDTYEQYKIDDGFDADIAEFSIDPAQVLAAFDGIKAGKIFWGGSPAMEVFVQDGETKVWVDSAPQEGVDDAMLATYLTLYASESGDPTQALFDPAGYEARKAEYTGGDPEEEATWFHYPAGGGGDGPMGESKDYTK